MEIRRGEMARAENTLKEYLKRIPSVQKLKFVHAHAYVALTQASRGNLPAATVSIKVAKRLYKMLSDSTSIKRKNSAKAWIDNAQGSLALANGNIKLAEEYFSK